MKLTARRRSSISITNAGMQRSPTQTTAQANPCTFEGSLPRISALALLQLAQWCRQRWSDQQGGDSCRTSPVSVCPPIVNDLSQTAATERTVAAVSGQPTAAALPSAEPARGTSSPSRRRKGG